MTGSDTVMINDVRTLRIQRGYTLQELASRIGTTPTQISRLELGHRQLTPKWKKRIAAGLDIKISEINAEADVDDVNYSRLLDDQNVVEKIFIKNPLAQEIGSGTFDREFLLVCYETVCSFQDITKDGKFITTRLVFVCATQMHDIFSALFRSVGKSVELLTALRHFVLAFLLSVTRDSVEPLKDEQGKLMSQDAKLAFFQGVLDPLFDPVEQQVIEKQIGRQLTVDEIALFTKADKNIPENG